ncbi:MAG: DUF418 domain-containing protein [Deltaproteobacteria bacterium]|nr:DUF418 domain-containing protein [Deltaproteobacteria bacterium]
MPTAPLVRRHVALIAIGLLHATLVWPGDILAVYGTLGLLLLPLRRTSTKRLVLLATLLLSLPVLCWGLIGGVALFLSERVPEAQRALAGDATLAAELSRLYGAGGDYPSFVRAQLATLTETYFTGVVTAPAVFAAFLFGVTLARARWLHVAPAHEKRWRRVRAACLFPALAANGALAAFHFLAPPESAFDGWTIAHFVAVAIGGPSLCAIYVASAALTMGSGEPRSATTRLLAKAGRLSLSFYLMQSVIFAALFYPWGFGLASGVSVAEAEVIAVGVYALQLAIAAFWFDRFRRGPFEQIVRAVSRWRVSL